MTDLIHLVSPYSPLHAECKSQSLNLAPFLNFVVLYFAFVRNPQGELYTTILKCAPIVSLMFFVVMKGFGLSKEYRYSQLILIGLIFSCGGDILLNIDMFPHGMGSFGVAQIFYISAFGFKPLKWKLGLPFYVLGAIAVGLVFNRLEGVLIAGLPIYGCLLLTMCWRSLARAVDQKSSLFIFCAIGSILFVLSDSMIAIDMFLLKIPYARLWIMITYYLAQFAIALSTATELSKKKSGKTSPKSIQSRNNSVRRRVKSKD
ncbi:lysoplasmalogenase-like protein TMEM86A isoform X1 [Stomoxys calcitrans]|uniref:lysoplasmalogenase n=1 Tax=Stomoxys calcitrans TaxID=35570 RepID=A0A1I8PFU8_STOCA|nr:lysoplasmalogenase-like protein TMEM86A isoform X1 [Stomoxys calcitrans]